MIDEIKCKNERDNKKWEICGIKYKDCDCDCFVIVIAFLNTQIIEQQNTNVYDVTRLIKKGLMET